ncbi:acyl-CoA-binding protein [Taibaiella lutea]|uniref:Acyl-CoA-binding protein n=1 Tax=Taibaiella lutea TaxID=2608001 RepID=A0A5M6CHW8_9BACT|nr:acyl-CoA-binding protein [Taibaiella lutea]KAA5534657.1 acyl-CoA-binding protein [Taibaiella lutea]
MNLKEKFDQAVTDSKTLTSKPDNDTLLKIYGLYKQATAGDAPEETDFGMFDFVAKAKHESWKTLKGKGFDEAMQEYIDLIQALKSE